MKFDKSKNLASVGIDGCGVYATKSIAKGTIMRKSVPGVSAMEFRCKDDLPKLTPSTLRAKLSIVPDFSYIYQYFKAMTSTKHSIFSLAYRKLPLQYLKNFAGSPDDHGASGLIYMNIPGSLTNHASDPARVNSQGQCIDGCYCMVALRDIAADEEIAANYIDQGEPPQWWNEFTEEYHFDDGMFLVGRNKN